MTGGSTAGHEGMWRRTFRQARGLLRFHRRHGKVTKRGGKVRWSGVLCSLGIVGALVGLFALRGGVGVGTVAVCATGAVGAAAINHYRRNRTLNHGDSRRTSLGEKREHAHAMRAGTAPPSRSGGPVHVGGHTRDGATVGGYTRAAPGQGGGTATASRTCVGKNPNSNEGPDKLRKQGRCPDCADRGFWTDFGTPGEYRHVTCPKCGR